MTISTKQDVFDKMLALFDKQAQRIDNAATKEELAESDKRQVARIKERAEASDQRYGTQIAGVKTDVMNEVNTLIRDALNRWMEEDFVPAVEAQYRAIETQRKADRRSTIKWTIGVIGGSLTIASMTAAAVLFVTG